MRCIAPCAAGFLLRLPKTQLRLSGRLALIAPRFMRRPATNRTLINRRYLMSTVALDNVLKRIARVTGHDPILGWRGWHARCPAHDDPKADLSIGSADDC